MNKIFVGGLSWNTTSEELSDYFAQIGEVTHSRVIADRETGRSRGFGFVTFATEEAANSAIECLDGTELDGRNIRVNLAEVRQPRPKNRDSNENFNQW